MITALWRNLSTKNNRLIENGEKKRARSSQLSISEIMTLLIVFHQSRFRDFKSFYIFYVQNKLRTAFPGLLSYNRFVELFNDLWGMETEEEATTFLVSWCEEVEKTTINPFKHFAKMIKLHWTGIVNFCETEINNGILEGIIKFS